MHAARAAILFSLASHLWACAGSGDGAEVREGCTESRDCARGQVCVSGRCRQPTPDAAPAAPDSGRDSTLIVEPEDVGRPDAAAPGDAAADAVVAEDAALDPDGAQAADAEPDPPDAASGPCQPGAREDCGLSVGRCRLGTRVCGEDRSWGPCEGGVGPIPEVCNAADDDCNGEIDDGFDVGGECDGVGACGRGVVECRSTVQTRCSTDPGGSAAEDGAEVCNDLDDDCDGRIDEDLRIGQACVGACGPGELECGPGDTALCSTDPGGSRSVATPEVCDRRDNDCDGTIDEDFGVGGGCDGVGACGLGVTACGDDGAARCSSDPGGEDYDGGPEICDGIDNDCDGSTDEGLGVGGPCEGAGACGAGTVECSPAGDLRCSTDPGGSQSEAGLERCNGLDDDCDDAVDEGLGLGAACPAVGACPAGLNECGENGAVRCSRGPGGSQDASRPERCDGIDDDCDGAVDEAFAVDGACRGRGACGAGRGECAEDGGFRCSTDPGGSADASGPEVCDGVDNDCDGTVDEGAACGGDICGTAPPLTFDAVRSGNTRDLADDYERSDCLAGSAGPDQVFRIDVVAPGDYAVGVAPLAANFAPLFWITADCAANSASCVPGSGQQRGAGGLPRAARVTLGQARTYSLIIDSRDPGTGGPFVAAARPIADGERCNRVIDLPVPGRFVGTTEARGADIVSAVCPPATSSQGPDQIFSFTLDQPQSLRLTVTPGAIAGATQPNPVLYVTRRCVAVVEAADCVGGTNAAGAGAAEQLVLNDLAAGTYFVVVDHAGNPGGPFFLEITPL